MLTVSNVGCVPYWIDNSTYPFPPCSNISQLYDGSGHRNGYMDTYDQFIRLAPNDLWKETQCPPPCEYIEYEVI